MRRRHERLPDPLHDRPRRAWASRSACLEIPRSSNMSGWSNHARPDRRRSRTATGPTALVLGGVHGDEPEGQVAALNLARDLRPEQVSGRRDRDPVRLARRVARLHAALAVGRQHEPLVPGLARRAGATSSSPHFLSTRALPALGHRRRHALAAAARRSACPGRRCTGSTTRSSAGRWSTGCSPGTPTGAASTSTSRAPGCSSARPSDRARSWSAPSSAAAATSPPRSTGSRACGLRNVLRRFGVIEGEFVTRASLGLPEQTLLRGDRARRTTCSRRSPACSRRSSTSASGSSVDEPVGQHALPRAPRPRRPR